MKPLLRSLASLLTVALVSVGAFYGCRRPPRQAADAGTVPALRLYILSTVAGAIEPCGCTKDMLGGVSHVAAFVRQGAKEAPHSLVLGAGPMLFMNPKSDPSRGVQDRMKAEALARSFADIGLAAWAPGANDWAMGPDELGKLTQTTGADLLAGNLTGKSAPLKATRIVEANGLKVGIVGVSDPMSPVGGPPSVEIGDARAALQAGLADVKKAGADVRVALVAMEPGRAMRLADQVSGFNVFVVGKPFDQGDGNDAPHAPALVGETLVVEAPNHLQGVAVVDFFVRGDVDFKDGTGIQAMEQQTSLTARIGELEARIADWEARRVSTADVAARKQDLVRLKAELAKIPAAAVPAQGSFYRYRFQEIREKLGADPAVSTLLDDYYRQVNDANREAFKDKKPAPVSRGQASYIGVEDCANCHEEEYKFWQGTPHSHAYVSLSKQHKEFNLDCVGCHVTGYEKPGGSTVTFVDELRDVGCEVCHGPGSLHEDHPSDKTLIVASPAKTLCAETCHHLPHVQPGWSADDAWKVIVGKGHGSKS